MLVGERVQEPPPGKMPPLVSEAKVTVPVGVVEPLVAVLVTVAVQDVAWPIATVLGEQVASVLVELGAGCSMTLRRRAHRREFCAIVGRRRNCHNCIRNNRERTSAFCRTGVGYEKAPINAAATRSLPGVAPIYTIFAFIAPGLKYLLLVTVLFAPGTILDFWAPREQNARLFTPVELGIFGVMHIGPHHALTGPEEFLT